MVPLDLNTTAACVLGLLQLGPPPSAPASSEDGMTGWDLYAAASVSVAPFWSLTRSQVYRELGRLADEDLVEQAGTGPRDRRPYRITRAGEDAFRAWLREWVDRGGREEQLRSPVVLAVFFGDFVEPERLQRLLDETALQHMRARERLERMRRALRDPGRPPALALRHGIGYHRLMAFWIEDVRAAVDQRAAG